MHPSARRRDSTASSQVAPFGGSPSLELYSGYCIPILERIATQNQKALSRHRVLPSSLLLTLAMLSITTAALCAHRTAAPPHTHA